MADVLRPDPFLWPVVAATVRLSRETWMNRLRPKSEGRDTVWTTDALFGGWQVQFQREQGLAWRLRRLYCRGNVDTKVREGRANPG